MDIWPYFCKKPPAVKYIGQRYFFPEGHNTFFVPTLWSINIYDYSGVANIGKKRFDITPGSACIIPPGKNREFHVKNPSLQRVIHFKSPKPPQDIDAIFIKLDNLDSFYSAFDRARRFFSYNPSRTNAEIWKMLWDLREIFEKQTQLETIPDLLIDIIETIEIELASQMNVTQLADNYNISTTHLIRLFKKYLNTTPGQYIKNKKLQRVYHLIKYSDIPINTIACEIGISDLHAFNKFIRNRYGLSPRAIRKGNVK